VGYEVRVEAPPNKSRIGWLPRVSHHRRELAVKRKAVVEASGTLGYCR